MTSTLLLEMLLVLVILMSSSLLPVLCSHFYSAL